MEKKNRIDLLKKAIEYTDGARLKDYGSPVDNHQNIANIFNAITDKQLTAKDIALVQVATKLARLKSSPKKDDHYIDIMAYIGIAYECEMVEK
tara:strand:- start:62 stop:340 length:279 start_codon:yes stop_codon:yes gene_type:complete